MEKPALCWESSGCDVQENRHVLHIAWKTLLVSSPDVTQWCDLRRGRALRAGQIHPDIAIQKSALEYHDAPRVDIAFDDGVALDLDALSRGHGADDPSAEDNLFGLDIALDDAGASEHDLSRASNGALHCSFDLEDAGRLDVTNNLHTGCDH